MDQSSDKQHTNPADLRREYTRDGLHRKDLRLDPFEQFERWFDVACKTNAGPWYEPNIMTLATVDQNGAPTARIVLLKSFDRDGLVFFTNYNSTKGRHIAADARVAIVFHWAQLERQVRIEGLAEKVSPAQTRAYVQSRPRGSQLGALASEQSQPVDSRADLEKRLAELEQQTATLDDDQLPMSEQWGGYRVRPHAIEFWQGRANRLHDRFLYKRDDANLWRIVRLQP